MNKLSDSSRKIFTLNHLTVINVAGQDAAKFLQGQLTCDVTRLTESQAGIASFCNPKGRVISTLLIVKTADAFLLILPASLLHKVFKKLQMYILRSAVQLSDCSDNLPLYGLHCPPDTASLPQENFAAIAVENTIVVKLPASSPRYLCIGKTSELPVEALGLTGFSRGELDEWRDLDILSGFPWFEDSQSELYIPQMLNIDTLGGISFSKGCYTGQEIIARTHYLGKTKRGLFPAAIDSMETPASGMAVINSDTQQGIGHVLIAQTHSQQTRMLLVLQTEDAEADKLILDDAKQTTVKILPYP